MMLTRRQLALYGLGLLLAGAVFMQLPSLYRDWRFLHNVRIVTELQMQQQQTQSQSSRPAVANESPPKK